jgi:S-(hydroxymethyl)glutathione dehydrogenase/alcohol dehydrogenase
MKAAVLYEPHTPLRVEDLDLEGPKAEEVRVKMVGSGVCHSDYHRIDGHTEIDTLPFVLGHEGAGVVTEVGPGVTDLAPGDHVVFSLTPQCGRCRRCTAGRPNLCEGTGGISGAIPTGTGRFSKDGVPYYHALSTFAEETVVSSEFAIKIRDDVPLEKAVLIGCGVMTGVGAVINRAKVEAGSMVAVLGCGGVGLNVVQGAVLASASKIIAVDKVDFKLKKAEELGATHVINVDREDPVKRIIELTDGGADYAFEVVGFPEIVRQAFESLRPGGPAVMLGVPPTGVDIAVPGRPLFLDRTLMGTFYGAGRPRLDFPWLLELYLDGRLKLDELITRYRPLNEINEAFEDMATGVAARTVITFE